MPHSGTTSVKLKASCFLTYTDSEAGQIANYMYRTKCKYGWLTTYNQIMFFRQEPHPTKKGKWVLCHSPVIEHNTKYEDVPKGKSDDPTQYRGRVTLTECFLHLAKEACKDGEAINTMNALAWVGPDSSRVDIEDDDYISFDEKSGESGDEKSQHDKGKYPVMTRGSTRSQDAELALEELQTGTEQISIQGQSHAYSGLEWKQGIVSVSFDSSESRWYYTAKRKRVYVELHKDPDEGDFFVANKLRYRVRKHD